MDIHTIISIVNCKIEGHMSESGDVALFIRYSKICGIDVIMEVLYLHDVIKNSLDTIIRLKINKDTDIFLACVYILDDKSLANLVMTVNLFDIL